MAIISFFSDEIIKTDIIKTIAKIKNNNNALVKQLDKT